MNMLKKNDNNIKSSNNSRKSNQVHKRKRIDDLSSEISSYTNGNSFIKSPNGKNSKYSKFNPQRYRFNNLSDFYLLKHILRYKPFRAGYGMKHSSWEHIRNKINQNVSTHAHLLTGRACRDRFKTLCDIYSNPLDESASIGQRKMQKIMQKISKRMQHPSISESSAVSSDSSGDTTKIIPVKTYIRLLHKELKGARRALGSFLKLRKRTILLKSQSITASTNLSSCKLDSINDESLLSTHQSLSDSFSSVNDVFSNVNQRCTNPLVTFYQPSLDLMDIDTASNGSNDSTEDALQSMFQYLTQESTESIDLM